MKQNYENWAEFLEYQEKQILFDNHIKGHKFYLALINKISRLYDLHNLLEVGIGTGYNTIYLSKQRFDATGVDKDKNVLKFARKNNLILKGNAKFFHGDIRNLPLSLKFDLIHSDGVLEHFDKKEIVNIVKTHLKIAKINLIVVPNHRTKKKVFGNERFYNLKEWLYLIHKGGGKIIDYYAMGGTGILGYYFSIIKKINIPIKLKIINRLLGSNYFFIIKNGKK